jgi:hypothetical protein
MWNAVIRGLPPRVLNSDNNHQRLKKGLTLEALLSVVVVAFFATTASRTSSPDLKTLRKCLKTTDLSRSNRSANWFRVSQSHPEG